MQRELDYTRTVLGEGSGTTSEILIQTPRAGRSSVLSQDALLLHHRSVLEATKIQVHMFARWVVRAVGARAACAIQSYHIVLRSAPLIAGN